MSWRPPEVATASRPPARLDAVLRAGMAKTAEDDESGLTRSLKNTSLVPTGACLPRGFDPDSCAYDGYYAIGVAVVSAVVGALVDADVPNKILMSMYAKASNALGDFCHKRPTDAYNVWMGNNKPFSQMDTFDKIRAMENFPTLCNSLNEAMKPMIDGERFSSDQRHRSLAYDLSREQKQCKYWEMYREEQVPCSDLEGVNAIFDTLWQMAFGDGRFGSHQQRMERFDQFQRDEINRLGATNPTFRFHVLLEHLVELIMLPGAMLARTLAVAGGPNVDSKTSYSVIKAMLAGFDIHPGNFEDKTSLLYVGAMAAWTLKNIAHYMNEHALMIASFFRINARRLGAGEAPMLDLVTFARQCREDIADGPNPPPQPPAYEAFDPEAVAAERRRLDEQRERLEKRDPLMEGLDYPETYASASGAAPLRK